MERAGVTSRSARALPWYDNDRGETFQHHAEYLKRLSKLREELIQQEQSNLANALDRLRMRSYGSAFCFIVATFLFCLYNYHHSEYSQTSHRYFGRYSFLG